MRTERKTPFKTYTNGYTFQQAKRIESKVPYEKIKQALDFFFKSDGHLQKADEETDHFRGIDYFYHLPSGQKVSLDLKVRQRNHDKLVVEVKWYNSNKKAWLQTSEADYFLFVHTDYQNFDFYLVSVADLRSLVQKCAPKNERVWIDRNNTAALMWYYDYDDLAKIGKNYAYTKI